MLSIVNNTTNDTDDNWFWHTTLEFDGILGSYRAEFTSSNWLDLDYDLAFYLTGPDVAVPEPSTLLLFGTGLIGIGVFRRKFQG
jgi:hypothetical protein